MSGMSVMSGVSGDQTPSLLMLFVMHVNWFGHRMDNSAFQNGLALGRVQEGERSVHKVHIHVGDDAVCGQWHLQTSAVGGEGVDAIGLIDIEEGQLNDSPALGVKQVDPKTPDYSMIKGWLHQCDELHHTTCCPLALEDFKRIKLVDVKTCQIIKYPPDAAATTSPSVMYGDAWSNTITNWRISCQSFLRHLRMLSP